MFYGRKLSETDIKDIISQYQKGALFKNIAARYGISKERVNRLLRKNKIKLRTREENSRKYTLDENYLDIIDTQEKAYWLGFMYADGYHFVHDRSLWLKLCYIDKEILEKFKLLFKTNKPLYYQDNKERKCFGYQTRPSLELCFTSKRLSDRAIELGLVQAKSLILQFPTSDQVPEHLLRHFIRGYFDGDGGFSINNKDSANCFLLSTNTFLEKVKEFLAKELPNITCSIKQEKDAQCFRLSIHGVIQTVTFADYLYKDSKIFLLRKKKLYDEFRKEYLLKMEKDLNNPRRKRFVKHTVRSLINERFKG